MTMYTYPVIQYLKEVNVCLIVQLILVGWLLVSENQATQINIILGLFFPVYNHFLTFKNHLNSSPTENTTLQQCLLKSFSQQQIGINSAISTSTSLSSSTSSSPQLTSSQKSQLKQSNFEMKRHSSEVQISEFDYPQQQSQSLTQINYQENDMSCFCNDISPKKDINLNQGYRQRNSNNFSNILISASSFSKPQNNIYAKSSHNQKSTQFTSITHTQNKGNSNSILSYWPMYCLLLIIQQQLIPQQFSMRHDYQIIKCLLIFILRGNSFSIYLFLRDIFAIKGQETSSLFKTPKGIQQKNDIIMKKIDDQIKCYSRFNISHSKEPVAKSFFTNSINTLRRSNS